MNDVDHGSGPDTATFNILFVCTGNTCRSPMAEVIARDELARRGWAHVQVASAGVAAAPDGPASAEAVEAARRQGLDLSGHAARRVTPELVRWADLVLAMGPSHLRAIAYAGGAEKAILLGEFAAGEEAESAVVSDPFGGSLAEYERTFEQLRQLVGAALERLSPLLHP